MKNNTATVDQRINTFMKHKMNEFPELKEKYGPSIQVVQRGYFLEDIKSLFSRKVQVR